MNFILVSAITTTFLYGIVKFLQMRFITKENRPFKELVSDSCIVFLVTFAGLYAPEQLGAVDGVSEAFGIQNGVESGTHIKAFTGKATF